MSEVPKEEVKEEDMSKILELESEISCIVTSDSKCTVHFHYTQHFDGFRTKLVTYNPAHKSTFILHQVRSFVVRCCEKSIEKK